MSFEEQKSQHMAAAIRAVVAAAQPNYERLAQDLNDFTDDHCDGYLELEDCRRVVRFLLGDN